MEKLVYRLQVQVDSIMHHPWHTSERVWQRWAFWIMAALPLVLLIMLHNLLGGLLDSPWRTSATQWQRSCFWVMLGATAAGAVTIVILTLVIWLPAK